MVMADPSVTLCERLTRRHVGKVVGHENIVSASRMNSAIVVFLNDVEKVRKKLTQNGIVVNNETILVSPLSSPAKKVMLSNVPPFISDEAIGKELSRYGRMVSPIKKIPLGWHLAWACPERQSDPGVSERTGRDAAESAGVVPPAVGVRPAAEGPGAAAAPDLTESEPQAQPAAQNAHWSYVSPGKATHGRTGRGRATHGRTGRGRATLGSAGPEEAVVY
ncbi:hypothetical protein QTP86_025777 [Hemibagrus guttatus]|nr:hypothetical protein QTP86_025777 [Hemibagrus guttatus]